MHIRNILINGRLSCSHHSPFCLIHVVIAIYPHLQTLITQAGTHKIILSPWGNRDENYYKEHICQQPPSTASSDDSCGSVQGNFQKSRRNAVYGSSDAVELPKSLCHCKKKKRRRTEELVQSCKALNSGGKEAKQGDLLIYLQFEQRTSRDRKSVV